MSTRDGAATSAQGDHSRERHRVVAVLALASLVAVATWGLFLSNRAPGDDSALVGFPLDDAWIHLVYARSLATEGGFHFNPGVSETGMTSPLWVVFAAGVHLVTAPFGVGSVVVGTKILSLLFGVGSLFALHALARRIGIAPWAALLAACLAAADPAMTFSRAAGMEVPLFTLLVLLALAAAADGELVAAGIATGLALVARPEGALVVPSVAILAWFAMRRGESVGARVPADRRRVTIALAAAVIPALAYASFCLATTGRPLPNTFYAKFRSSGESALGNLLLGWRDYLHGAEPYFLLEIGTLLALAGAFALVRRRGVPAAAVLGAGLALFAATLASRGFSAGHFHYWERWLIPSYPFFLLACAGGVEALHDLVARRARSLRVARIVAAAAIALLVAKLPATLATRASEYAWNCRNIQEMNVALGRWVDAHVPADEAVAVGDAGALRYFGRRETVDLFGLNDHRIKEELRAQRGALYLAEHRVRWFVLFPVLSAQLVEKLGLEPVHRVRVESYTIARSPQHEMIVYRWPRPDLAAAPEPGEKTP